ncbi:MAG: extracellular solute-binding protein [Rhodocyclaceae bacterium]|nr:extracellular solute-binding protein [Rhodocyclaceae bacterium]
MFSNRLAGSSRMVSLRTMIALGLMTISSVALAKTELTMAHQLEGQHALELEKLVGAFNADSKDVEVRLIKRSPNGKPAVLNLATRADLAQYLGKPDAYVPVEKLLADNKIKFNPKTIADPLRNSVTVKGQVQALPVAFTTPLLFWNKTLFRESGLDANKPPKTWEEVQDISGKLKARCSYTTSWPVWVHIDNVSAWAGAPTVTSDGKLAFNTLIQVRHLARLTSWYKTEYFTSFGYENEADAHFVNGECAMITTNGEIVSELQAAGKVDFGVTALPVIDDNAGAPFNTLASGGAIWVGQGFAANEYKAAAKFLEFTLAPQTQLSIARQAGFLPLTPAAQAGAQSKLLRDDLKAQDLGLANVMKPAAAGANVGWISFNPKLRQIVNEEMDAVFMGKKSAKSALDSAVARGQAVYQPLPTVATTKKRK